MTIRWKTHLIALAACALAILALLHRDVMQMANIWWNVSTYNHAIFIPPIVAWLIWQRAPELVPIEPRSWWPGLFGIALAGIGWALGEAGGIAVFRHAATILMLQSLVLTILGPTVFRALLFPVFYLVFLVPVGEEAVPFLQTITAQMSMVLLHLVSVPATIDGVFIRTPVGLFEVAEACSGVKFLVAMIAYAALAANVCFKSWKRRAIFMGVGIIVPVLANGARAFSTIWVSELTGSVYFAESFDHIIFGWVFFAVVMVLVMGLGWRWFDRKVDDAWIEDMRPDGVVAPAVLPRALAALGLALALVLGQQALASMGRQPLDGRLNLPDVAGWQRTPIQQSFPWEPRFDGADHRLFGQYINKQGQRVDVAIVVYAWQEDGREIVGYAQGAFDPNTRWSWANATKPPIGGKAERIFAPNVAREVASFYWIGGDLTGSATRVKLKTLTTRLTGRDQTAVAFLISAEDSPNARSRPAIDAFLASIGPLDQLAEKLVRDARQTR